MSTTEDISQDIIVVSGFPRSGTSMMMQMLATGGLAPMTDEVRQADEDNPKGYYEFERVKALPDDAGWLPAARGKVVKMVYRLLYELPAGYTYRVVFMVRPFEEVIASQDVMLERHGKDDPGIDEQRLRDIYARQLQACKDWLDKQPNFSVIYVKYHNVLESPAQIAAELNQFLGGNLDTVAMAAVPDSTLYRQRRAGANAPAR